MVVQLVVEHQVSGSTVRQSPLGSVSGGAVSRSPPVGSSGTDSRSPQVGSGILSRSPISDSTSTTQKCTVGEAINKTIASLSTVMLTSGLMYGSSRDYITNIEYKSRKR